MSVRCRSKREPAGANDLFQPFTSKSNANHPATRSSLLRNEIQYPSGIASICRSITPKAPSRAWQRRSGPKRDAGHERGIVVLAGPLAKDCPESCQATRISGWRIVGWERHPYLTINYETGLPVLSPAHQHISGDGNRDVAACSCQQIACSFFVAGLFLVCNSSFRCARHFPPLHMTLLVIGNEGVCRNSAWMCNSRLDCRLPIMNRVILKQVMSGPLYFP